MFDPNFYFSQNGRMKRIGIPIKTKIKIYMGSEMLTDETCTDFKLIPV